MWELLYSPASLTSMQANGVLPSNRLLSAAGARRSTISLSPPEITNLPLGALLKLPACAGMIIRPLSPWQGEGAPLNWCRAEVEQAARHPSAVADAGNGPYGPKSRHTDYPISTPTQSRQERTQRAQESDPRLFAESPAPQPHASGVSGTESRHVAGRGCAAHPSTCR